MKNCLAAMVLAQPTRTQLRVPWLAFAMGISKKNFLQFGESLGKISEDFGGNFTFIAPRTKDARHQKPL